jgi:hypothetical protein
MEFLLHSENWQEKTIEYYVDSLSSENEAVFLDNVLEPAKKEKPENQQKQEGQIETIQKTEQIRLSQNHFEFYNWVISIPIFNFT